ncbi:MAG: hypothetical protein Q8Q89_03050 [bacterium]|nr:hypothetical protein [bacterium]
MAKKLIERGFGGEKIIGFSSDTRADQLFKAVGTGGAIVKNTKSPNSSLKDLAALF